MLYQIEFSKKVEKALDKIPRYILVKLQSWVDAVEKQGIYKVRKLPGYHDEPLAGDRKGQRSIRLSKAYRAFYIETNNQILIIEVNKHDY